MANLVPPHSRIADVGTDHGYLPVWLLRQGRVESAIASDIAPEPLEHARRTAKDYGATGIDFRLCPGLDGVSPEEVDTVIIAGMGGDTVISILHAAPWTKDGVRLIVQPMTKVEMLRGWIADNGYIFTAESLIWDKEHLYPVMCITGGNRPKLTAVEEYAGTMLTNDPLYRDYLTRQIQRLQKAAEGLNRANDCCSHARACEFDAIRRALEEMRDAL